MLELKNISIMDRVLDFSLTVGRGEIIELQAPSACGKTLLFSSMLGLYEDYLGTISIKGQDGKKLAQKKLGFIFEFPNLISNMSIRENLSLVIHHLFPELSDNKITDWVYEELDSYQLIVLCDKRPAQLTPGQLRLICFIRATMTNPELLLWDNALAGYADWPRTLIQDKLQNILQQNGTIILFSNRDLRRECQHYQLQTKLYNWQAGNWNEERS